jgi:hypothetical protein
MSKFSERMKIVTPRDTFQITSMDIDLRTAIWNSVFSYYLISYEETDYIDYQAGFGFIFWELWLEFLNQPMDKLPAFWEEVFEFLRSIFFSGEWNQVYDVIEFIANNNKSDIANQQFASRCNQSLEKYLSGYRFVNKTITPITTESEIESIETAINNTDKLKPINIHIQEALVKLSDRTQPDFRNSIKESISAVEALCRLVSGNQKATLGDALKTIQKKGGIKIHLALINGFSNIYGWTNDAQGIRHSLMDVPDLTFDDAKFMLVSCSAFINYLIAKSLQAGITLD